MNYYALQVRTKGEENYIKRFAAANPELAAPLHFPQRALKIRRGGKIMEGKAAVFPGYIFAEAEDLEGAADLKWAFRRTEGFYRFLPSNQNISPLAGKDLETALYFIKRAGPVAGISKVYFDENSRIVVRDGPLSGLIGKIIKVDKRKGRAKVRLDIYDDSFCVDLAFEVITPER